MNIMVKQILIWIISVIFLSSCLNTVKNFTQKNNTSYNNADTSINKFILRDTSCMRQIKVHQKNIIEDFYKGEGICLSNNDSTEFLYLAKENGGYKNQYCYFYLLDSIPQFYNNKIIKLSDPHFTTSQGLHIGSTMKEFAEKTKCAAFNIEHIGDKTLYFYTDSTTLYTCKYIFHKNKLHQIEFGYVW